MTGQAARVRALSAAFLAAVGATAPAASPATTTLVSCGTLTAAGKTWHVEAADLPCRTARRIVGQVAVAKPDRVLRPHGGEVDQYAKTFSGLRCSKSQGAKVGGAINCTSSDGKQSVFGIYKSR